ncbi:PTS glucose transporter subunit IIA [Anaerococcus sp.]|uniref:PTS sugar transporter subunit IIA n=1 Tax=Anaerococcus sp. TaxID=1872515 RepID=UPI0027BA9986|nr:PTS glucose transporter subunit IIA [Anaerococcus sp.]
MSFLDKIKSAFSGDSKKNETVEEVREVRSNETILAPLTGEVKDIKECSDPVFAQEIVGKGVIIVPTEGKVYAPVDGKISMLAETGHAVGITSDNGTELLIHIGLDTVELEGKPFDIKAENNANVKRGDLLIEFNIEEIKAAGKEIQSPVIVTNTDDKTITSLKLGQINHGEDLLKIEA